MSTDTTGVPTLAGIFLGETAPTDSFLRATLRATGSSPDGVYTNNLHCVWNISLPSSQRVALWFTAIDIETSAGCTFDALMVYDGAADASTAAEAQSTSNPMVAKLCGNFSTALPDPYVLSSKAIVR